MSSTGSDLLIEGLISWGVDTIFGMPGDGINGVMEAIRVRRDKVRFVQVRHEESAALMACAHAKLTGKLGCCLATTGPGGIHLLNGLYDAKLDRAPVIALTGLPYHDLVDTFTQQDVDHNRLFADVALYTTRIMSAAHVENAVALACRTAIARRGVAHLSIPIDVQEETLDEVDASPRNVAHHVSFSNAAAKSVPSREDLDRAVSILDSGKRVAILAGQGAAGAREELLRTADLLAAPIVKALLGKSVIPDSNPMTTGGIGLLGTRASQWVFEACDTLLIVGSTFPYVEYYPKPDCARGVQVDLDPTRIGLRFPAEVGLVGDARATLSVLNERLQVKTDRSFLQEAQARTREWWQLLRASATRLSTPMKPETLAVSMGDRLADDAIVAWDSGHNTGVLARCVCARPDQRFVGSGMLATMGCAVPYAIAAALAFPGRQVVAFVGDGGLSMLLGELATIARYRLPIKIVVMKNNTLGQIKWEQMMFLGNPEYECDLEPIDFAKVADAMGIRGFAINSAADCGGVLDAAFGHPGAALVEASVDPNEPLLPPKRMPAYVQNLEKALTRGTAGSAQIRRALEQEPSRTLLRD
jgi:thiamine pyrophosphate-dependent acetolactate synthase large subunit-like protein